MSNATDMGDELAPAKSYSPTPGMEAWQFGCPEGTWTGRLDRKEWGKSTNLKLYFTDEATGERCWFSVWHLNGYTPRKGGLSFKTEAAPGEVFELTTQKTKDGKPNLITARKISGSM